MILDNPLRTGKLCDTFIGIQCINRWYATIWENVPSQMCIQWRLKSARSCPHDYSLLCPHEESLHLSYPKCAEWRFWSDCTNVIRAFIVCMKKLCILGYPKCAEWSECWVCKCTGWADSSLGTHVRRYIFRCWGSYDVHCREKALMPYVVDEDLYQPAYWCSLIRPFVFCLQNQWQQYRISGHRSDCTNMRFLSEHLLLVYCERVLFMHFALYCFSHYKPCLMSNISEEKAHCSCYSKTYLMSNTGLKLLFLVIQRPQTLTKESACDSYYSKTYLIKNSNQRISLWFLLFKDLPYIKYRLKKQLVVLITQRPTLCWKLSKKSSFGPYYPKIYLVSNTASMAQLDARLTGDQEVAGSTPPEVGNILSWRLIMKYFLRSFSPFSWFKKGSCQFLAKECAQYWLTI